MHDSTDQSQRAFRQRKEAHIVHLEEQVHAMDTMDANFRTLQNENFALREYILDLQGRLLETQTDFPPAPAHANITSGHPVAPQNRFNGTGRPVPEHEMGNLPELGAHQPPRPPRQQTPEPAHPDPLQQLQQAAAQANEARMQESPYEPHGEYPAKRPRTDDEGSGEREEAKGGS